MIRVLNIESSMNSLMVHRLPVKPLSHTQRDAWSSLWSTSQVPWFPQFVFKQGSCIKYLLMLSIKCHTYIFIKIVRYGLKIIFKPVLEIAKKNHYYLKMCFQNRNKNRLTHVFAYGVNMIQTYGNIWLDYYSINIVLKIPCFLQINL